MVQIQMPRHRSTNTQQVRRWLDTNRARAPEGRPVPTRTPEGPPSVLHRPKIRRHIERGALGDPPNSGMPEAEGSHWIGWAAVERSPSFWPWCSIPTMVRRCPSKMGRCSKSKHTCVVGVDVRELRHGVVEATHRDPARPPLVEIQAGRDGTPLSATASRVGVDLDVAISLKLG